MENSMPIPQTASAASSAFLSDLVIFSFMRRASHSVFSIIPYTAAYVYLPPRPHTLYQTKTEEGLAMRRDADREERNARLLAGVVLAAMLVMLSGIIHLLYHREYAETDTPNDCFAVSAATGRRRCPKSSA